MRIQYKLTRSAFQKYALIPAMKAAVAHFSRAPGSRTVRPPLTRLTPQRERALLDSLETLGFRMPGL